MGAKIEKISIVIPAFNEEHSIEPLYRSIMETIRTMNNRYEIIFVDDGSTDGSFKVLQKLQRKDGNIKLVRFKSNLGKASGLSAGFSKASGDIIFTMDADLQDDPQEIPNFLKKLDEGYDLVSGWKYKRYDPKSKTIPSKIFNWVTSRMMGLKLHDFNCGFKAYRQEVLREIKVYGELHRYIPALAYARGFRVGEIKVKHHPRKFGKSKYGFERFARGLFDLLTVLLITKSGGSPLHLFGISGSLLIGAGFLIIGLLTILQLTYGSILGHKPLSYFGVLMVLLGFQSISLGLLSEMLVCVIRKRGGGKASIREKIIGKDNWCEIDISFVICIRNNEGNLPGFYENLAKAVDRLGKSHQIVFIDDGSTDNSFSLLREITKKDRRVSAIRLRRKFGTSSALCSAFDISNGKFIMILDPDDIDSLNEIPKFYEKIEQSNFDLIRNSRRVQVTKIFEIVFKAFNLLFFSADSSKEFEIDSGPKIFRREVAQEIKPLGDLYRFLPMFARKLGYRVGEVNLGIGRNPNDNKLKIGPIGFLKLVLDFSSAILLSEYRRKSLHYFGFIGVLVGGIGFIINLYLTSLRLFTGTIQGHYTLLLIGVMLIILGAQWVSTGLLSELINHAFGDWPEQRDNM